MLCHHRHKKKLHQYGSIIIFQCQKCNLIFSNKLQKNFNPQKLYKNYYKNEILTGRFKFGIEHIIKLFRFFRAFKIFTICPNARTLLDIGSGRGHMLYFLKKYYHYTRTIGTQLDQKAREFSRNKLGLKIYSQDLLNISLKPGSFDIVTLFHVLEHIPKPELYLKTIHKVLKKSGTLIIEVPNFDSWTRSITAQYWLGLDLKYHLNFFTPLSLTQMLKKYHYKIKNIHTFSLEYSFFISMQSLISLITKSDQLFFNWLQGDKFNLKLLYHMLLFILFSPICFLINLFLFYTRKGEVLLIIAQKK